MVVAAEITNIKTEYVEYLKQPTSRIKYINRQERNGLIVLINTLYDRVVTLEQENEEKRLHIKRLEDDALLRNTKAIKCATIDEIIGKLGQMKLEEEKRLINPLVNLRQRGVISPPRSTVLNSQPVTAPLKQVITSPQTVSQNIVKINE